MSLLAPWLLFPLVLGLLSLGCGLALERVAGIPVPGSLLLPVGLAVIVVLGLFTTADPATAQLTVPAVVGLAVLGLAGAQHRLRRLHVDRWASGAALAVFSVFAAPVVLSGSATFAGYIKLDDTATFLALTDRVMEHGRSLAGLAPSSYEATLAVNLSHGYPIGSLIPLGVGKTLVGQDGAWVYQPYLAFLAAMLALVLYEFGSLVVRTRPLRAIAAAIGAQPALLYGFALWGGVKELAAAPLLALVAALVRGTTGEKSGWRQMLPLVVSAAALVGVLSIGGALWVVVPLVATIALSGRGLVPRAAAVAGGVILLSLPTLADARTFVNPGTEAAVRSADVLGNLVRPLEPQQLLGIWPVGDFRFAPSDPASTRILLAAAGAIALLGVGFVLRSRAWSAAAYLGSAILGTACIAAFGSPWVVAKAYAIASPAFLFAAALGGVGLVARGRRTEGAVALAALAGGVIWSNVLAYHDVNLAPRAQLRELEQIGRRFAGQGPALMTEYQPYGVRHFLRSLDAEGASELRRRPVLLRDGKSLDKGAYADLATFRPSAIDVYRTLVLRRSPLATRPPHVYRLVWSGRFYDVWQRPASGGSPVRLEAGRVPACTTIAPILVGLGHMVHPGEWPQSPDGAVVYPTGGGTALTSVEVRRAGRYTIWVGGSFRRRITAIVDGTTAGSRSGQLNNAGQYTLLGALTLAAGSHALRLRYSGSAPAPGSGGSEYGLGPLVLSGSSGRCG